MVTYGAVEPDTRLIVLMPASALELSHLCADDPSGTISMSNDLRQTGGVEMAKYPGLPIDERKSLHYDLRRVSDILANAHLQLTVAFDESSSIAKEAEVAVNAVDKLLYSLDN